MKTSIEVESCNKRKGSIGFSLIIMLVWVLFQFGQSACFAGTLTFAWNANTESDLAGYKLYYGTDPGLSFNGTGATEGNSPIDVHNLLNTAVTGLDPSKTYYFAVTAYNTSGIESPYSSMITVPGTNPLTTTITAPLNNEAVSGTVSVAANVSDPSTVTKVEFYVNGVLQATDTAAPYLFSWDTATLASGSYTLMSKACSSSGNTAQSENVVVLVTNDTTAPAVSLASPGTGTIVSGTVTITVAASDNVAVSKVELYSNGTLLYAGNLAPYTYTWDTTVLANGSYVLTAKAYDNSGNVGQSASVAVTVSNGDATEPTVTAFSIPASASSTTVAVTSLTATDNLLVTGYMITEAATVPSASAAGWSSAVPISFTFSSAGSKTAYAWAKDAAGNVSASRSASVNITLPTSDKTAPIITVFVMPTTATSLTVPVNSVTATDDVAVTGYMITENLITPSASSPGWLNSVPTALTFSGAGGRIAIAWAKDAAGNVSSPRIVFVSITLDSTAPVIDAFSLPTTSASLTVPVATFTASDAVGVTGYMITESTVAPLASTSGWSAVAPVSFTFAVAGPRTAYAWTRDAAGNVSASSSATVSISLPARTLTISDALVALQVVAGSLQPTVEQKLLLDVAPIVNGSSKPDGKVDLGDVIVILGKLTGKIAL